MKRGQQLIELGFERNDDQQEYYKLLHSGHAQYADFRDIYEYKDDEWNDLINLFKEDMYADNKKYNYRRALLCYGITPLLMLLQEYENTQNFEECQWILIAIADFNSQVFPAEEELQTRYDENTIPTLIKEFEKYGFSGDIALSNMDYYVEKVKEMVK